jgi:5-methylcytosine-specific restriction endonuclease McrA
VLPFIKERAFKDSKESRKRDFDGDMINIASLRLRTFQEKGCTCVRCGVEGTVFLKDRNDPSYPWHFNLYGKDKNGDLVLMTKDHILPKSKGGRDHIDNMQTMCTICNSEKGNTVEAVNNG